MKRQFVEPERSALRRAWATLAGSALHAEHLADPARERQREVAGPAIEVEDAILARSARRGRARVSTSRRFPCGIHLGEPALALEDEVAVDLEVDDRLAERAPPALAEEHDAADRRVSAQKLLMVGVVVAKRRPPHCRRKRRVGLAPRRSRVGAPSSTLRAATRGRCRDGRSRRHPRSGTRRPRPTGATGAGRSRGAARRPRAGVSRCRYAHCGDARIGRTSSEAPSRPPMRASVCRRIDSLASSWARVVEVLPGAAATLAGRTGKAACGARVRARESREARPLDSRACRRRCGHARPLPGATPGTNTTPWSVRATPKMP